MRKTGRLRSRMMAAVLAILLSAAAALPALAAVRLPAPEDVYWGGSSEDDDVENGTYAYWDEVEDAYQYEVYLYCDEKKVKGITTKKTRYNFSKYMTKEGDYSFRVRALSKKSSRSILDGYWSDYSGDSYIDEERIQRIQNDSSAAVQVLTGQWIADTAGWWYRRPDGSFPFDGWFQDPSDGNWYFFDGDGYMVTGWIEWDGQRYYCDMQGSPSGAMAVGDRMIEGISYTFDETGALIP